MPKSIFLIIFLILLAGTTSVNGKSATRIGKYNDWGTYRHQTKKSTICYVLTVPLEKKPKNLDHGEIFFFVSYRPEVESHYEPQLITGYDFQEKSTVLVSIDRKTFSMFSKGRSAWVKDKKDEPALLDAMRSGMNMKVQATSKRGNPTSYSFSLKGLSSALDSLPECSP